MIIYVTAPHVMRFRFQLRSVHHTDRHGLELHLNNGEIGKAARSWGALLESRQRRWPGFTADGFQGRWLEAGPDGIWMVVIGSGMDESLRLPGLALKVLLLKRQERAVSPCSVATHTGGTESNSLRR